MTTVFNTIEKLKASLIVLVLDNELNYLEENGIKKAINEAIDTLTLLNKPAQVYIPHLNEFIVDKQFYIWYEADRTDCSFSIAITNWTKEFAQSVLDMLAWEKYQHKNGQKAEGASEENDTLIAEAAELVLSKFEYIEAIIVI